MKLKHYILTTFILICISNSLKAQQLSVSFNFLKNIEFDHSFSLVYSIWLSIVYFISSMLILLPFIFLHRNSMEKSAQINQFLKEKYQESLIEFLYNENNQEDIKSKIQEIAKTDYNKQFLINEIIDLSINLKGETTDQLRKLYLDLKLNDLTLKKVHSRKWHLKIKAFRELAFMNLKGANEEILKAIGSKNDILSMEAQIALVRLNESDPFRFLDHIEKPFTLWEQMNIHELIILHNLSVPEFKQWIRSGNKSVAIFAINMIRVFKQTNAFSEIVGLLDSYDPDIREAVINALGTFKINEVLNPLKEHFQNEIYENKTAILKALQKSTDESNIPFLKWVLENESDVNLQIEAAKGIRNVENKGEEELSMLIQSEEYRNYQIILKHVLDKRI